MIKHTFTYSFNSIILNREKLQVFRVKNWKFFQSQEIFQRDTLTCFPLEKLCQCTEVLNWLHGSDDSVNNNFAC